VFARLGIDARGLIVTDLAAAVESLSALAAQQHVEESVTAVA
jgi:hypothetical protein